MKIKCKISDLQTIVKLVSLKGKDMEGKESAAVEDCILTAAGGKITVSVMDVQGTFGVKLDYKLIDIQEEGSMPIGDIEMFIKFLQRFSSSDVITMYTSENRIVIERENPKKTAKLPLVSEESIVAKAASIFSTFKRDVNGYPSGKSLWNLMLMM